MWKINLYQKIRANKTLYKETEKGLASLFYQFIINLTSVSILSIALGSFFHETVNHSFQFYINLFIQFPILLKDLELNLCK